MMQIVFSKMWYSQVCSQIENCYHGNRVQLLFPQLDDAILVNYAHVGMVYFMNLFKKQLFMDTCKDLVYD